MKKKSNKNVYNKVYREILASLPVDLWLFLVKHNALKRYLNNCVVNYIKFSIIKNTTAYMQINTAFRWDITREGVIYWYHLFTLYLRERNN